LLVPSQENIDTLLFCHFKLLFNLVNVDLTTIKERSLKKLYCFIFILFGCGTDSESFFLNEQTYPMWHDFIQPTEQELAWTSIPWKSSFQEGLIEASTQQKPMLLWAMNGHPLGCT